MTGVHLVAVSIKGIAGANFSLHIKSKLSGELTCEVQFSKKVSVIVLIFK